MAKWKTFPCPFCSGSGVVSVYSMEDFEGPGPCNDCGEKGYIFVSERDRIADWPGGPFNGVWPGKFAALPDSALWEKPLCPPSPRTARGWSVKMNDCDGNPIYPRYAVAPTGWTGAVCMRMILKPKPYTLLYGRDRLPRLVVTHELCRGEIVGKVGEEGCSYCGAKVAW